MCLKCIDNKQHSNYLGYSLLPSFINTHLHLFLVTSFHWASWLNST